EANSPFQVAWLSDEKREEYLDRVRQLAEKSGRKAEPPIVFEGNAPADINKNRRLMELLNAPDWPAASAAPIAWLGDPVAIKEPTGVTLRRQSGANVMIVGQQEESAMALQAAMMLS